MRFGKRRGSSICLINTNYFGFTLRMIVTRLEYGLLISEFAVYILVGLILKHY